MMRLLTSHYTYQSMLDSYSMFFYVLWLKDVGRLNVHEIKVILIWITIKIALSYGNLWRN